MVLKPLQNAQKFQQIKQILAVENALESLNFTSKGPGPLKKIIAFLSIPSEILSINAGKLASKAFNFGAFRIISFAFNSGN